MIDCWLIEYYFIFVLMSLGENEPRWVRMESGKLAQSKDTLTGNFFLKLRPKLSLISNVICRHLERFKIIKSLNFFLLFYGNIKTITIQIYFRNRLTWLYFFLRQIPECFSRFSLHSIIWSAFEAKNNKAEFPGKNNLILRVHKFILYGMFKVFWISKKKKKTGQQYRRQLNEHKKHSLFFK